MEQMQVIAVMQDAIMAILKCSLPMMVTALVIGVVVSIIQAATQINEQTLAFVPKIIGVLLAMLVCFGFIMTEMSEFTTRMYGYVLQMAH